VTSDRHYSEPEMRYAPWEFKNQRDLVSREPLSRESRMYGAVEAGGTKFVCAIGDELGRIHAQTRFPTTDPAATLSCARDFLRDSSQRLGTLAGIGIASFGPVILDRTSARYGFIGRTPKAGWGDTEIVGFLAREFSCPIGFDTDVNAAALAEHRWGAARDVGNLVYVTVGTGIGGGVLVRGIPLHGLMHAEIGHIRPRRHPLDVDFDGVCPFHRDCLEGLASGPAIVARAGAELQNLGAAHPQWELEADYLGQLCATLVFTLSPQRIILGGGVMTQVRLLPDIQRRMLHWLGGYMDRREIIEETDRYVALPGLGAQAGVLGALSLAIAASAGV
jgi:fructokinase